MKLSTSTMWQAVAYTAAVSSQLTSMVLPAQIQNTIAPFEPYVALAGFISGMLLHIHAGNVAPDGQALQKFVNVGSQAGVISYATGPVAVAAPSTKPVPTEVKLNDPGTSTNPQGQ